MFEPRISDPRSDKRKRQFPPVVPALRTSKALSAPHGHAYRIPSAGWRERSRSNLTTFNYLSNSVRVVDIDGQPWFVATDVCRAINLTNPTMAVKPLRADEKGLKSFETPGGPQVMNCITESGLYKLGMRAQRTNPVIIKFQDWVTRDVLPSIRKDGMYVTGEEKAAAGEVRSPSTPSTKKPAYWTPIWPSGWAMPVPVKFAS